MLICALLDAPLALLFLFHVPTGFSSQSTLTLTGQLSLAAGLCAIAAKPKSWRHLLRGLALLALGVLYTGLLGPRIGLTTIALLQAALAISLPSIPFTILFLALAAQLIPISHNFHPEIVTLAAWFAYSAYVTSRPAPPPAPSPAAHSLPSPSPHPHP